MRILLKNFLYDTCFTVRNLLDPIFHFTEVSILAYHSLSVSLAETAILPEIFEEHLGYLRKEGVSFVSLEQVVEWRRLSHVQVKSVQKNSATALPKKSVAITFDDGYADFETTALPILEKYRVPVTLFIVGDAEGSRTALGNEVPLMDARALERVHAHPLVTLAYHSLTHANLAKLRGDALAQEVQPIFPEGLLAKYFAFPGGNYSKAAIAAVHDAGYDAGFSIKPTLVSRHTPRYLFPRSVIMRSLTPRQVYLRTTKAIAWYRRLTRPISFS
jgi:peptidoglycan/xylan/chitin deacetylase (PgdA/CDA1 family)